MPRVRTGGAKRYAERAAAASEEYLSGVLNPRRDWESATKESEANWKLGVERAAKSKLFSKGVSKAGNSKYLRGVQEKGVTRYSEGVALAEGTYAEGVQPYLDVIEGITLPTKYPKGDPRNIKRVEAITKALHERKQRG